MGKKVHAWISDMFNHLLQHDMHYDWTKNWIKLTIDNGLVWFGLRGSKPNRLKVLKLEPNRKTVKPNC